MGSVGVDGRSATRVRRSDRPSHERAMEGELGMRNERVNKRVLGVVLAAAALAMYASIFFKIGWG